MEAISDCFISVVAKSSEAYVNGASNNGALSMHQVKPFIADYLVCNSFSMAKSSDPSVTHEVLQSKLGIAM